MRILQNASLAAIALALAACGGSDGGGVTIASAPPPVAPAPDPAPAPSGSSTTLTPLAPTSGLIAGTFDTLAVAEQSDGTTATLTRTSPDQVRIAIDPATRTYTVVTSIPGLITQVAFDMGHVSHGTCCSDTPAEFGNHVVKTDASGTVIAEYDATSGQSKDEGFTTGQPNETHYYLTYDLGLRYVSLGVWSQIDWKQVGPTSWTQTGQPNKIYFVNGERTPADTLPVSGTATYKLSTIIAAGPTSQAGSDGATRFGDSLYQLSQAPLTDALTLSADFGSSMISADLNIPQTSAVLGDSVGGFETYYDNAVQASGSAVFARSGDFTIPLTGSILPDPNGNGAASLTGNVFGAFYGPHAENIGGLLQLTTEASPTVTVPFAALRQ